MVGARLPITRVHKGPPDLGQLFGAGLLGASRVGGPEALQRYLPECFPADEFKRKHIMLLVHQVLNRIPEEAGTA